MKKSYCIFLLTCLLNIVISEAQVSKTIDMTTAGILATLLTPAELNSVTDLTVTGNIDARDFKCMRDDMKVLKTLDMSGVIIRAYNGEGGTYHYQNSYNYPANETPVMAFHIDGSTVGKTSLETVILPTSISTIGQMSFYGCNQLKNISFPSNITSIGYYAFCYCHSLPATMNIGSGIQTINQGAFGNCNGITAFVVSNNNPNYSSVDGILYDKYQSTVLQCPCGKTGTVQLPSSLTVIGNSSFRECTHITGEITIPDNVYRIDDYAFMSCSGLTGDLILPENITYIGGWTFFECTGFSKFVLKSTTPPALNYTYCFYGTTVPIYVPASSIDNYKSATEWSEYSSRFVGAGSYYSGYMASSFAGGDGTSGNPYQISNAGEFALLAYLVNDMSNSNSGINYSNNKYFVVTANIDLGGPTIKWSPIGHIESEWTNDNKFEGNFDGGNFEIINLCVDISSDNTNVYGGLFGYTSTNSVIKNVTLNTNSSVKTQNTKIQRYTYSGGICAFNNGLIENCFNHGTVYSWTFDSNYTGGIAGYNKGRVINCYNTNTIESTGSLACDKNAGGIIGFNEGYAKSCYNNGAVNAYDGIYNSAGGIVGYSWSSQNIENCYNSGAVSIWGGSWSNYVGGIVGYLSMGNVINGANVGNLYITGNAPCYIGGITSRAQGKILNCYNKGNLSCTNIYGSRMGGIAAECLNSIQNCYSSGLLYNSSPYATTGNITAENSGSEIKNCYAFSTQTINNTVNLIGSGTITGSAVKNNSTFDLNSILKEQVLIENDNSTGYQNLLTNALNKWVSVNVSTSETPYNTWLSVNNYDHGFPIFGTPLDIPEIVSQPQSQTYFSGESKTVFISVKKTTQTGNLLYQWQKSLNDNGVWTDISSATDSVYIIENLTSEFDGLQLRCIVTNIKSGVVSKTGSLPARLTYSTGISTSLPNRELNGEIQIYPNPVKTTLYLKTPEKAGKVIIFDLAGVKLIESQISNNENKIDVSRLRKGIYNIQIENQVIKFIKE